MSMTKQPEGLIRKRRARMTGEGGTDEFDIFAVPPLVEKGPVRVGHTYRTERKRWMPVGAFHAIAEWGDGFKTHNEAMAALGTAWQQAGKPAEPETAPPAAEATAELPPKAGATEPTGTAEPAVPTGSEPEAAFSSAGLASGEFPGDPMTAPVMQDEVAAAMLPVAQSAQADVEVTVSPEDGAHPAAVTGDEDTAQSPAGEQGGRSEVSEFRETETVREFPVSPGQEFPEGWEHPRLQPPPLTSVPSLPATPEILPDPFGSPFTDDDRNPVQ